METLMGCALEKVRQGIIGPEEVLRVVPYEVGTRACPHCRFPLEDAYRYCPYCASPLGRHCPDCGQTWKPNWRRCPRCGRKPPEELQ
jgi:predicted amidophosphoribosyltransferase